MKKPKDVTKYNWHFSIPTYKIQVIVEETCFIRAQKHMEALFLSYWKHPNIKFQFGEKILRQPK